MLHRYIQEGELIKQQKTGFGTGKSTVLHMLMTQVRVSGQ